MTIFKPHPSSVAESRAPFHRTLSFHLSPPSCTPEIEFVNYGDIITCRLKITSNTLFCFTSFSRKQLLFITLSGLGFDVNMSVLRVIGEF